MLCLCVFVVCVFVCVFVLCGVGVVYYAVVLFCVYGCFVCGFLVVFGCVCLGV